jgi:hypothetical protein
MSVNRSILIACVAVGVVVALAFVASAQSQAGQRPVRVAAGPLSSPAVAETVAPPGSARPAAD